MQGVRGDALNVLSVIASAGACLMQDQPDLLSSEKVIDLMPSQPS